MSRGRAGVISKEYKGEENTEFHDIIKLFKIYRVVNWQMQIKINQVSVMLSLMYQAIGVRITGYEKKLIFFLFFFPCLWYVEDYYMVYTGVQTSSEVFYWASDCLEYIGEPLYFAVGISDRLEKKRVEKHMQ